MAWNSDGWRLARETFASVRRAQDAVSAASRTLALATNADRAARINAAVGQRSATLRSLGTRLRRVGDSLPTNPARARQAIALATRWKTAWRQLWGWIAAAARQGQEGLTLADSEWLSAYGWQDARERLESVPWVEVATLMRVPSAATPTDLGPLPLPSPSRPRERSKMQGLLPLFFLFIVMMSSTRR